MPELQNLDGRSHWWRMRMIWCWIMGKLISVTPCLAIINMGVYRWEAKVKSGPRMAYEKEEMWTTMQMCADCRHRFRPQMQVDLEMEWMHMDMRVDSLREHSYSHRISYIITLLSRGFRNLKRLSENVDTILLIHSSHILPWTCNICSPYLTCTAVHTLTVEICWTEPRAWTSERDEKTVVTTLLSYQ